jgi:hypothetical protein
LFTFVFDVLLSCIELLFVLFDVVSDIPLAFGSQFYSVVPHFLPTFPILLPLIFHLHFLLAHSLRDPSALARSPELSPLVPDLQPRTAGQLIASQISLQLLQQRRTYRLFQVLSLFGLLLFLSSRISRLLLVLPGILLTRFQPDLQVSGHFLDQSETTSEVQRYIFSHLLPAVPTTYPIPQLLPVLVHH